MVKLLIFSLLLGTLPVLILGGYSHYIISSLIENRIYDANMQVLKQNEMMVEQILKITDYTASQFVISPFIDECIQTELSTKNFTLFNKLSTELHHLQRYELGIRDVFFINLKNGWFVHNNALSPIEEYLNKQQLEEYINNESSSFWMLQNQVFSNNTATKETRYFNNIGLIKKIPINSSDPTGLLVVDISGSQLKAEKNGGMGSIIILDEESNILISNQDDMEYTMEGLELSMSSHIQQINNEDTSEGHFRTILDNKPTMVFYSKSFYNQWIYLYTIPISELEVEKRAIQRMTLLIALGIFAVTIFLSLQGTKWMYSPIRSIYETIRNRDKDDVQPKQKDEVQFIRDRVFEMVTEESKMKETINNHLEQLRGFFIINMLRNKVDESQIDEKIALYGFPVDWKWMVVISIQIDTLRDAPFDERDHELMVFAISNIVHEIIDPKQRLELVSIGQHEVIVLGGNYENKEVFSNYINSMTQMIQKFIREYLNLRISVGISAPFTSYRTINYAYLQSIEALKYRFTLENEAIIWWNNLYPIKGTRLDIFSDIHMKLIEAVDSLDIELADEILTEYFNEMSKQKINFHRYQFLMTKLLMDIIALVSKSSEYLVELLDSDKTVFERLFEIKTSKEVQTWFSNDIIHPIIGMLKEQRENENKSISQKVIDIIEKYYDRGLTLESCAEYINYNASYVSRVFCQETGMTFSDYLWNYRMEKAKEWLVNTDMKISDIAEKLEYNNAQNFIRSFRKIEDMTPGQYRKNYR